ncbi:MAG: putative ribosome biogenesis GTPase RsgA [Firmicutes bacterium ADurb.Bin182]|nr:MAG: putative ribosome biogenesis GTPase RsgA [Firmicutes bacterium ADurb.Bin182]
MHGERDAKIKSGIYRIGDSSALYPAAGDFVLIRYNESGESLIVKTLERKSKFSRSDFSGHAAGYVKTVTEQVIAANFDYVFIMASMNMDFDIRRLERYLALSWNSGGMPVIVLTKSDLAGDCKEFIYKAEKIAAGIPVFAVSSKTGEGIDKIKSFLSPGKTVVFLGSSGVGKSSLVNALAGGELMKVREIREDDSRGRHTTTHRQLIMLDSGVMIIDTPGMREVGMWDAGEGISETFVDVEDLFSACRFSDCSHTSEPGCAVRKAIESGELDESRWKSYVSLKREERFTADKSAYLRKKEQFFKRISKMSKKK